MTTSKPTRSARCFEILIGVLILAIAAQGWFLYRWTHDPAETTAAESTAERTQAKPIPLADLPNSEGKDSIPSLKPARAADLDPVDRARRDTSGQIEEG